MQNVPSQRTTGNPKTLPEHLSPRSVLEAPHLWYLPLLPSMSSLGERQLRKTALVFLSLLSQSKARKLPKIRISLPKQTPKPLGRMVFAGTLSEVVGHTSWGGFLGALFVHWLMNHSTNTRIPLLERKYYENNSPRLVLKFVFFFWGGG